MMEFAVRLLNEKDDKAWWVLDVDHVGERLLIAGDDNRLRYVNISECVLHKAVNPEMPRPVIALKQPEPLSLPGIHLNGR